MNVRFSPFTSWGTLGTLLNLFGLSFLLCKVGRMDPSSLGVVVRIPWVHMHSLWKHCVGYKLSLLSTLNNPMKLVLSLPLFTEEKAKAQRSGFTCPESHSLEAFDPQNSTFEALFWEGATSLYCCIWAQRDVVRRVWGFFCRPGTVVTKQSQKINTHYDANTHLGLLPCLK